MRMTRSVALASGALLLMLAAAAWWLIRMKEGAHDVGASTTATAAPKPTSAPRPPANDATPAPDAPALGTPLPSLWGTMRGAIRGRRARDFTSDGLTPDQASRIRTSPGPGSGVGISPTTSTSSAEPLRSYQAACMSCLPRGDRRQPKTAIPYPSHNLPPVPPEKP